MLVNSYTYITYNTYVLIIIYIYGNLHSIVAFKYASLFTDL